MSVRLRLLTTSARRHPTAERAHSARSIPEFTTRTTPSAASTAETSRPPAAPISRARVVKASKARPSSSLNSPPSKSAPPKRPRTRFASVTVGSLERPYQAELTARAQRHVRRSPAHVERDDVCESGPDAGVRRADDPARRAGEDRPHGLGGGGLRRDAPARRLHHAQAPRRKTRAETPEVSAHQRLQVSVDRDRRGALVLAVFGEDFVGDGERHAREGRGHRPLDPPLVFGPREREEERE